MITNKVIVKAATLSPIPIALSGGLPKHERTRPAIEINTTPITIGPKHTQSRRPSKLIPPAMTPRIPGMSGSEVDLCETD